jgi:hypothetical protein
LLDLILQEHPTYQIYNLVKQVFQPTNAEEARFLSVGTKEMMKIADDMLTDIGFPIPEQHLLPKIKRQHHLFILEF